ncbi:restriction endonuclease subunit S [Corynebacterium amycolatum]|uniref:Restriction endonuclease subunit S n=1 Tax=Corynebacterium amycolatum TaxID=43765 RepID=A0AAW9SY51_CORAY|nr:restriction endonuclease subunit S [Corynebacterium amycolatum]MDK7238450.1 restriction endonuclease subunit S [Corynebacterium amycolatum]MDK7248444.1 restriction endonuclease subunit S [Corynebacterium amycolatum]
MSQWPMVKLGDFLTQVDNLVAVTNPEEETFVTVKNHGRGAVKRNISDGKIPQMKSGYRVSAGQYIVSRIDARNGSFAIVPPSLDGAVVSKDFPVFEIDKTRIDSSYFLEFSRSERLESMVKLLSFGATNRQRIKIPEFLNIQIPLPPLEEQRRIAKILQHSTFSIDSSWREIELLHNLRNSQFVPSNTSEKVHLDELVTVQSGQVDPTLPDHQNQLHVAPDSIKSNNSTFNEIRTCAEDAVISGKYKFSAGDILYSKIRPYLNKVAIPSFDGVCSADMYVIKPKSGISAEYVRAILMSPHFLAYAEKESGRASIPKINRKALLSYKLPKPSEEDISVTTTRIREIDNAIAKMTKRMRLVEELHRSLATRAFAGQL